MSRYKVQFKPQGAIPQDLNLGLRMQKVGSPTSPDACFPDCTGWAVTVDGNPSTGDVNSFTDVAVTFTVTLLGELCPGDCLEWELKQLSFDSDPNQLADFVVTPNGCDGATVVGAGSLSYVGLWLGLYPSLNGKPFCVPILFRMVEICVNNIGPGATNTYFEMGSTPEGDPLGPLYGTDGLADAPLNGSRYSPRIQLAGTQICPGSVVTFGIVQNSGTTGQGESIAVNNPLPSGVWSLVWSFPVDLTGTSYTVTPNVDGIDALDQVMTFSYDVSMGP